MAVNVDAEFSLTERRPGVLGALRLAPWLALAALFAVALVLRHLLPANTDVSWLLTVAERVLDGQRLYVDVIETNPPMAVLTYIPGIAIARAFGWPVEMVTDGLIFAAIFASLGTVAGVLKNSAAMRDVAGWPLALLAFAILAILPTKTFGQREQIAVVELLPLLALYARRMKGESPPFWAVLAAGIGAGLAVSFKPHFVIGVVCGLAALTMYARSWRIVFAPENFIAGCIGVAYLVCTIVFYPAYFSAIVPLVRDIYILVGVSAAEMVRTPALPIWAAATFAALVLKRGGRIDGTLVLLLATSLGFVLVYFLQGKGWPYHSYPMIAFAMLGLSYALAARGLRDRALGLFAIATLAITFVQSIFWFNWAFDKAFDARPLWASVASFGPHPKILAITGEPGLGHPMTRALQGTWVSRQQGLWVAAYLRNPRNGLSQDPQRKAALEAYAAKERAMLIEDIGKNQPTVVLIDNFSDNWSSWLKDNPDVAAELADYRLVTTINDIEVRAKTPSPR
jgi:hypothetical protein